MKKRWLSLALSLILALTLVMCPVLASSAEEYPDLEGVRKIDLTELGIVTGAEGLDKWWAPIGGCNFTINDDQSLITVTPATTEGLYYGPASPYGGENASLVTNVALAMTLGVDFKEGAADFGYMLILKGDQPAPTWGCTKGLVMMVYPTAIQLCQIQGGAPVALATYNGTFENGKNYNVEFIAIDNADGTTDAWLIIKDENGNVLSENGGNITLSAMGIAGAAGEGWVTMFSNGGAAAQYRFGAGTFTTPEPPATEPPVTEPPVTEPPVTEPPVEEPPKTGNPIALVVTMMAISACGIVLLKKKA